MASEVAGFRGKKKCWFLFIKGLQDNRSQSYALLAVVLGISVGFVLTFVAEISLYHRQYLDLPGRLLMNILQMISIPLVVPNIITGVASMTVKTSRKIALRILLYVLATNTISAIVGFALVMLVKPGAPFAHTLPEETQTNVYTVFIIRDFIKNLIPRNTIISAISKYKTELMNVLINDEEFITIQEVRIPGTNFLGLIVWSVIFGILLDTTKTPGRVSVECFATIGDATKNIIAKVVRYIPFAAFCMMVGTVLEVEEWKNFMKLGMFSLVMLIGYTSLTFLFLPLVYFLCTKHNPYFILRGVYPALVTALLLSSSSATLPQTLRCCEQNLKIDKRVTRFMLPIVTTINKNGSTLSDMVSAIFITQMNAVTLDTSQMCTLILLSVSTSFASSGIQSVGQLSPFFILSGAGLPTTNVSILVSCEWIIDRCSTVLNVYSDCIGVCLIEKLSKEELQDERMSLLSLSNVTFEIPGSESDEYRTV